MDDNPLLTLGLPLALAVIMIGIGLTLSVADFRREARAPRAVVVGVIGQIVLMPMIGFAIASLLGLPPALAVGLIIVAACPGGTTSNLVTYLGRGNVALSIVLTVVASLITIVTLPIITDVALSWRTDATGIEVGVPIPNVVALLVGVVLVPVSIGMAIRRAAPTRAAAMETVVSGFGTVVLIALVLAIAYTLRDEFWDLLRQAGPAALLLNVTGVIGGLVVGALARLQPRDRLTLGIELGIKNSTLGILIAGTVVGSAAMAVPAAVYGVLMYLSAGGLVWVGRRVGNRFDLSDGSTVA